MKLNKNTVYIIAGIIILGIATVIKCTFPNSLYGNILYEFMFILICLTGIGLMIYGLIKGCASYNIEKQSEDLQKEDIDTKFSEAMDELINSYIRLGEYKKLVSIVRETKDEDVSCVSKILRTDEDFIKKIREVISKYPDENDEEIAVELIEGDYGTDENDNEEMR